MRLDLYKIRDQDDNLGQPGGAVCEANEWNRFQSLSSWHVESDSTRRVTNTHVCSADPARAREK